MRLSSFPRSLVPKSYTKHCGLLADADTWLHMVATGAKSKVRLLVAAHGCSWLPVAAPFSLDVDMGCTGTQQDSRQLKHALDVVALSIGVHIATKSASSSFAQRLHCLFARWQCLQTLYSHWYRPCVCVCVCVCVLASVAILAQEKAQEPRVCPLVSSKLQSFRACLIL